MVDRNGIRRGQRLDTPLDHIPGLEAARAEVRADHENRRRGTARRAPIGETNHHRNRLGDTAHGERAAALPGVQKRRVLEALGSGRHDPQIGRGVVDHGRDHLPEAQVQAHLHHHQNDGEDDADHRGDETEPVVEQIAKCEREDERHASKT